IPGERKRDPGSGVFLDERTTLDSRFRGDDDDCVIPGERERYPGSSVFLDERMTLDSRFRRNDDDCVIPGERERDPGSSVFLDERTTLDSRFRGNDDDCVIPSETRNPVSFSLNERYWIPTFAGMTTHIAGTTMRVSITKRICCP